MTRSEARLDAAAESRTLALVKLGLATKNLADAVRESVAAGMTESEAARRAGVSRPTVRAWLGKGR